MSNSNQVSKLYNTVVEDVINNVKEAFLDEGVDEQVLQDLKQLWESRLAASKALEPPPVVHDVTFPPPVASVMLPQPIQINNQLRPVLAQNQKVQPAPPQFQPSATVAAAPPQPATLTLPSGLFQQQITALGAGGQMQNITVQQTGNGQYITVAGLGQLPQFQQIQQQTQQLGQQVPQQLNLQQPQQIQIQQQQHQQKLLQPGTLIQQNPTGQVLTKGQTIEGMIQLDGCGADTSSSDDEDFDDDGDKEEEAKDEIDEEDPAEEEEPLNSDDDISEEDPNDLFDSDNVVVCQYEKINRNRNRWKFHLKDGIMSLNGRDFVFQKATGDSEW